MLTRPNDYEYDENDNLSFVTYRNYDNFNDTYFDPVEIEITYDAMENPFRSYNELNPIVYQFIPFNFDSNHSDFLYELVMRRSTNNVVSRTRTHTGSGISASYLHTYEYNDEGYPTSQIIDFENGHLVRSFTYEYY